MNSNVVYGLCNGDSSPYVGHTGYGAEAPSQGYYTNPSQHPVEGIQHPNHILGYGVPSDPRVPPLATETGAIVSDNGLSYTNLDPTFGGSTTYHDSHHHPQTPPSIVSSPSHLQGNIPYRGSDPLEYHLSVTSVNAQSPAHPHSGGPQTTTAAAYSYLDNTHHSQFGRHIPGGIPYGTGLDPLRDGCQINGMPPMSPHQGAHSNVPTYKWMQVKRNVPKPGKLTKYRTTNKFWKY